MRNTDKLLITTAVVAGAALVALLIKKTRSKSLNSFKQLPTYKPAHHLTDVFAKAKEQVNN